MKILLVYPNLPLMMAPSIAMAIFNAIGKREGCEVEIFETTQYSDAYSNRHIRMAEIGAARPDSFKDKDIFFIKPANQIIPDFTSKCESFKPDLILMGVQEDVWGVAQSLLESIKHLNIPHILGGVFITSAPELVINNPLVNIICLQEGECVIKDAIDCLKENKPITSIKGIWWKDATGVVHKNLPQPLCNISEITPDFTCFENDRWRRPMGGRMFNRAVSMETYRGCPYNCTYCNSPFTRDSAKISGAGNYMRRKSAKIIEKEFLQYKELYDPDMIIFVDDSFLARPAKEIFEFCEMWSKYKVPFWFNTRIENCKPEYLSALKEAGVYRMTFGIESGNEKYRSEVLKRSVTNEKYLEYFNYINESNIPYSLNVIIGMPFETRDMVLDTAMLVKASGGYDGLTLAMWQPYRGTELRNLAVDAGFVNPDYLNSDNYGRSDQAGGFLNHWAIKMPKPYLQEKDVKGLIRTFALYAHFNEDRWGEIRLAETDDVMWKDLMDQYNSEFFADIQQGGADRIASKFCAVHDATSTYQFVAC